MKRFWNRLRDRHDDGTKHTWESADEVPVGRHWCEWDYCRCFIVRCDGCGGERVVSAGSLELR